LKKNYHIIRIINKFDNYQDFKVYISQLLIIDCFTRFSLIEELANKVGQKFLFYLNKKEIESI
jgi:hypothetical protein